MRWSHFVPSPLAKKSRGSTCQRRSGARSGLCAALPADVRVAVAACPVAESDLIPARMLNEVTYCPRLFYLEHVAGEWEESGDTVSGKRVHRRVDAKASPLPEPAALPEDLKARSVTVSSQKEGIIAKVDLIEAVEGAVTPVDYKRGSAPDPNRAAGGVWPADRVQIGAQVLVLRDAGYRCDEGVVYYAASKTRVRVPLDEVLAADVRAAVAEARRLETTTVPPPPLVDSPKCPGRSPKRTQ